MNQSPAGHRLGKGMLYGAWILVLIFLTWVAGLWLEQRHNPNSDPESRLDNGWIELTLTANPSQQFIVSGKINHQPADFLLDTGATTVVIPLELAKQYGLTKQAEMIAQTANGSVRVFSTQIDELSIGDIRLKNLQAVLNPAMHSSDEILLGMSALIELELLHRNGEILLRQNLVESKP